MWGTPWMGHRTCLDTKELKSAPIAVVGTVVHAGKMGGASNKLTLAYEIAKIALIELCLCIYGFASGFTSSEMSFQTFKKLQRRTICIHRPFKVRII